MQRERLAIPVVLLLAACSAGALATPTEPPTPTLSPTATPTASASPSPTPTATTAPLPTPTPTTTPTPSQPPSTTPTSAAAGWIEVSGFPTYGADTHVTSITFASGRLVAVGWSHENDTDHGRVWTSVDGMTWTAQPDPMFAGLSLTAVAHNGTDFYAFGGPPASVWRSADGAVWTKVALPELGGGELGSFDAFTGGLVADAATSGDMMYAAGSAGVVSGDIACDCAALWSSTNGTDWSQSTVASQEAFQQVAVATDTPQFIVAIGNGSYIGRAVWIVRGPDFDWQLADIGLDQDASWGFIDAASDTGRVVAVGYRGNAFDEPIALVIDGSGSSVETIDTDAAALAEQVTWTGGAFVAVGTSRSGADRTVAVSWTSLDGVSWQRGPTVYDRPSEPLGPEPGDDPISHRTIGSGQPGVVVAQTFGDGLHVYFAPLSAFGP